MRVAVIFDSKYGCTKVIAEAIAEGIKVGGLEDVRAIDVNSFYYRHISDFDVMVVGSPTHYDDATRRTKYLIGHASPNEGVRYGAAFGTRLLREGKGAAMVLDGIMRDVGITVVHDPMDFRVDMKKGPLLEGEIDRAKDYGRQVAERLQES